MHYIEHLQREDHLDNAKHQADLPKLEKDFHDNNSGSAECHHMSLRPQSMYSCVGAPYLWSKNNEVDHSRSAQVEKLNPRSAHDHSRSAQVEKLNPRSAHEVVYNLQDKEAVPSIYEQYFGDKNTDSNSKDEKVITSIYDQFFGDKTIDTNSDQEDVFRV